MVKRRTLLLLPLLILVTSGFGGCPKDPYTASMAGSKNLSDAVSDALTIIPLLEADKLITQAQEKDVLGYLGKITVANQTFRNTAKTLHQGGTTGVTAYLSAADLFVKDVQNQQLVNMPPKLQPYLTAIDAAIKGVEIAVSNAKGVVK